MHTESEIPTVSAVQGQGADARRLIRVGDWTLTQWSGRHDERPRVRDIDLAKRAGLAVPRDVRRTIQALIDEGTIVVAAHDGCGGHATATALAIEAFVRIGSGAKRAVTEYWLDEEAALHVLMALRTPMAIEVRRQVVHVFVQVRHGLLPTHPAIPPEFLALVTQLAESYRQIVETQRQQGEAIAALAQAVAAGSGTITSIQVASIRQLVDTIARGRVRAGLSTSKQSACSWIYNRIFSVAGWTGTGRKLANMPADRYATVLAELDALRREVAAANAVLTSRQLTLARTGDPH